MKKHKGTKLFPILAAVSILLLVGVYAGMSTLVTADKNTGMTEHMGDMQTMMQGMSTMMGDMNKMHEECGEMMKSGDMNKMGGMMGSSGGMSQEEHESHHK
ncbi:hypothetical protein HYS50_02540 [Candidatus Woesearchaeota archaeon]|nr:hypothetical protein [Candidatus Woesearchaeota archaeon]